ncbi:MAG: DUF885 domain-containing protein [Bacteroidia bacterium]|nr:DUF885 domain-containing protein [Bacteroidia bacterium]
MNNARLIFRLSLIFPLVILLSACEKGEVKESYAKKLDQAFEAWAKYDNELMDFYQPSFASNYSNSEKELADISREGIAKKYQGAKEGLSIVQRIDTSKLSAEGKLDVEAANFFFETLVEGEKYAYHECLINPVDGIHFSQFEDLAFSYSMKAKNDGDYYLAKVRSYPQKIEALKSYLNECSQRGTLPPRPLLEAVARQAKNLAEIPVKEHPIYKGIARQLGNADPVMINELEATDYMITSARTIEEYVVPAYKELLGMIEVLIKNSKEEISINRFEDGKEFYNYQLKKYTGRSVNTASLHASALAQLDSLLAIYPLTDLKKSDSLVKGILRTRIRMSSLDSARAFTQRMKRNASGLMDNMPQAGIYINEMPDWAMEYTPNFKYYTGSLSGKRRGILLVDMSHPDYQGILTHQAQIYQNGIPGLHLIKSGNYGQATLGDFLKFLRFEGNDQGWKVFSGDLVVNVMGLLQSDKTAYAEYSQGKLLALAALIVDTGIQLENWSRDEAVDFLVNKISLSQREAVRLVDEAIIYPGKNCAPWIGYLDLLELQSDAQKIMGDDYYLQTFHDLIMRMAHSPFNLTRSRLPLLLN